MKNKQFDDMTHEEIFEIAKILNLWYSRKPESEAPFDEYGVIWYLKEIHENGSNTMMTMETAVKLRNYLCQQGYEIPTWE